MGIGLWLRSVAAALLMLVCGTASAAELKIGVMTHPTSLDPHFHNLTPNNSALSHVFERLVTVSSEGVLKPALAVSWTALDETRWEFKLREGVKWHNGTPFTADDVVFTFERAAKVPDSPAGFAAVVSGKAVTRIDDLTVQITTPAPYPLLPNVLTGLMIVSRAVGRSATTTDYNSGKAAVGTGPYRFAEYVANERLVLTRNDEHWAGRPRWDKISIRPIKDGAVRVSALLSGDVDMIDSIPTAEIERLETSEAISIVKSVTRRVIYFHLDHDRQMTPFIKARDDKEISNPLKDLRVRRALSKAINREAIVTRVMSGAALPASQLLSDTFPGTSSELRVQPYDPEGAKVLLAEAGFPNGFKLTIHGPDGRYTNDVRLLEAIAPMFTRIGVETSIETLPPAIFFQRASRGDQGKPEFSFILVGWSSETGEASDTLRSLVATHDPETGRGAANRGRYSNPELDRLLVEARRTIDAGKRNQLLAKASEIAVNDVAIIPVHYPMATWGLRKGLKYSGRVDEFTLGTDVTAE